MDAELRSYLESMEQRMLERTQVRDAQTEVLRGFERYLTGVQIRLRTVEAPSY